MGTLRPVHPFWKDARAEMGEMAKLTQPHGRPYLAFTGPLVSMTASRTPVVQDPDWLNLRGVDRKWPEIGVARASLRLVCPLVS